MTWEPSEYPTVPSANGSLGSWSKSVATSTPGSGTESTFTQPGRMSRPQPRFSRIPVAARRWLTIAGAVTGQSVPVFDCG
jgi:hypothetical protein